MKEKIGGGVCFPTYVDSMSLLTFGLSARVGFFYFQPSVDFLDCNNFGIQHIFQYHLNQSPTNFC